MIITGIEVIRGNHEAIGGDPGLALEAVYPEKVELTYGDRLQVSVSLEYKGLQLNATLYGAIGVRGITFDEKVAGEVDVTFPKADAFTPWSGSVQIPITADIVPGTNYDIYCKIKEYLGAGLPEVDDVIDIVGVPPTMKLIEETIYPYAYVYDGPCEVSTFTFTTIPFTPASWISGKLAATVESEVRKAGGRVMEMRVYVDENLLRPWTNWRIEVVGTVPSIAASIGIAWWAAAILAALAIILIIAITWSIKTIVSTFNHKPNIEEVKPTWSRETLISVIGDFETKLKKVPTPPEDLKQMSDDELRTYTDQLAGQIAPGKGIPWGWVALGAGALGVLALASKGKPGKAKKA